MKKLIAFALLLVTPLFVSGCKDTKESWIEGKWHTEAFGLSVEFDFRSNGEVWARGLDSELLGTKVEESADAKKAGTWSFDGKVLQVTVNNGKTEESVITQTEDGFVQEIEGKLPMSYRRP